MRKLVPRLNSPTTKSDITRHDSLCNLYRSDGIRAVYRVITVAVVKIFEAANATFTVGKRARTKWSVDRGERKRVKSFLKRRRK